MRKMGLTLVDCYEVYENMQQGKWRHRCHKMQFRTTSTMSKQIRLQQVPIFVHSKANGIHRDGIREVGPLTSNCKKRPFHLCFFVILGHVDPAPCDQDNRHGYPLYDYWHWGMMCPNDVANHAEKAAIGCPQQKHVQLHHGRHKWSLWVPKVYLVHHI